MSDFRLIARTGLGLNAPLAEEWDGFSVREEPVAGLWWVSVPSSATDRLAAACARAFGCGLPEARKFATGRDGGATVRILAAGDGQYAILSEKAGLPDGIAKLAAVTDQSDGWIAFWFSGPRTRDVMERLCGIDLHPDAFPAGACARAPIEGMAAMIACVDAGEPRLLVMTQRSSARSFADHVRHAAASACGGR